MNLDRLLISNTLLRLIDDLPKLIVTCDTGHVDIPALWLNALYLTVLQTLAVITRVDTSVARPERQLHAPVQSTHQSIL